jgi:hypothetical protein
MSNMAKESDSYFDFCQTVPVYFPVGKYHFEWSEDAYVKK